MNILFLTDNFPPEVNAPANRTYEHCLEWVKLGAEVTVITCVPNFPSGKVYQGYKDKIYLKELMDGITVIRVWSYMSANKGVAKRILDHLSFSFSAFLAGLFTQADIIVATSPQFFTCWVGWALSKFKRIPWVFELRDLWPESITAVGAMEQGWVMRLLEKIELALYRDADLIVPVTHSFKSNLISRGIEESKIKVITNSANTQLFSPRPKDLALVKKFALEDKFVFGYIGTHGMAHSLEFVVESLADVKDTNIHFLFIGDGARKERITRLAKDLDLQNILFLDTVSRDEVPAYMSIIDAALVPLKRSDTFKMVIPSKVFEACAMEKPILLGVDGEVRSIIEAADAGLYFEPDNREDFLRQLRLMKEDRARYTAMKSGCRNLSRSYERSTLAKEMFYFLQELTVV